MNNDRFREWVMVSHPLARVHAFAPVTAQNLGRLDSRLLDETPRFLKIALEQQTKADFADEPTAFFNDHILFSYLWVLGSYELVRLIDQSCRENADKYTPDFSSAVKTSKALFERVRIPLAKFEPAHRHRETDSAIAWPVLNRNVGAGWKVSEATYISRQELSDSLMSALRVLNDNDSNAV